MTSVVKITTTPQIVDALDELVRHGLWGRTRSEVAEGLIRAQLVDMIERGYLPVTGAQHVSSRVESRRLPPRSAAGRKRLGDSGESE